MNPNDYLTQQDIRLISDISDTDFNEVLKLANTVEGVYTLEKALRNVSANRKGIHIYRVLLADRIIEARRHKYGYHEHPYYKEYKEKGAVVIHKYKYRGPFFLPKKINREGLYPEIARMIAGYHPSYIPPPPSKTRLKIAANDIQFDAHVDTFHSVAKTWVYLHAVEQDALNYVFGSHESTESKLRWLYRCSLIENPSALSFRVKQTGDTLATLGYDSLTELRGDKGTLIIADTSGLHCRGQAPGKTRVTLRGNLDRFNPFSMDV